MRNNRQRQTTLRRMARRAAPRWTPELVGLAPEQYAAALRYLFDRPVPARGQSEWYWNIDEPEFEAKPLEWTQIQTVLFANAGDDLAAYSNEQVGMGLNYLISNSSSDVPFAATDPSVPLADAMRMMGAFPALWRDCIGPRLVDVVAPIGSSAGRLGFACYMWFDVWPTFWNAKHTPEWRDALWQVFDEMLDVPCREVQIAALHGIGHEGRYLQRQPEVDARVTRFIDGIRDDEELKSYAEAARCGQVQ